MRVAKRFCRLSGIAVALLPAYAQSVEPAPSPTESAQPWRHQNRSIGIAVGTLQQRYSESDPLARTSDGILDAEQGNLPAVTLTGRWQGPLAGRPELPDLHLQAQYRYAQGDTGYSGFLQSGNVLTPLRATSGNQIHDLRLRAAVPLIQGPSWQWLPFVEYRHHQWLRELAQYQERFDDDAALLGLAAQWRAAPRWMLEAEMAAGRVFRAHMSAPALAFDADLGKRDLWRASLSAGYDLAAHWRVKAAAEFAQSRYGSSAAGGPMIEPASKTRQSALNLGIEYLY